MKALGVDLAGSPGRPTGVCILDSGLQASCAAVFTDEEILSLSAERRPDIIAVDAPLSLPEGRRDIECNNGVHLRACDRELLRRKIRFFPVTLGPMRMLASRGIRLKAALEDAGFTVEEVYPGAAQDVLGIARQRFPDRLLGGLEELGIQFLSGNLSVHELDAATAAYVGLLHLEGLGEVIGGGAGGGIVLPRKDSPLQRFRG